MAAFYLNGKQASQHEAETLEGTCLFLSALFLSCPVNTVLSHMGTTQFAFLRKLLFGFLLYISRTPFPVLILKAAG